MALTNIQRTICRLLAASRISSGESYVAGGTALNELIAAHRVSRDIDLFHDEEESLAVTWAADRVLLQRDGFRVEVLRERPSFVEAMIREASGDSVLMQWTRESAFRFFPLVQHELFGLTMHPFDLATNKVLALVGRLEVRDWIDVISCDAAIQPLGYLTWAACGKDPGFTPKMIIEQARRSGRYSEPEVAALAWNGAGPSAAGLGSAWHKILDAAEVVIELLPSEQAGQCVLGRDGTIFRGDGKALRSAIESDEIRFHRGSIRGAFPSMR